MGYVVFLAERAEKMDYDSLALTWSRSLPFSGPGDFRSKQIETRLSLGLFLLTGVVGV